MVKTEEDQAIVLEIVRKTWSSEAGNAWIDVDNGTLTDTALPTSKTHATSHSIPRV